MPEVRSAEFVAFDLETTGLAVAEDRIIEIGAVRFAGSGAILATFERLINPLRASGVAARAIHGIRDECLTLAPTAEVVLPEFVAFLGDPARTTLLAHHSASDAGFLGRELTRAGLPFPPHDVVDTLAWSRRRWPHFGNYRLDSLARRFGPDVGASHRALADSLRVRQLYLELQADDPDPTHRPLAYPIHDGAGPPPIPRGWAEVAGVIARAGDLRIKYAGGTRGLDPREVTPERFTYRGGVAYLVARCHLDGKTKEFQVDRVRSYEIIEPVC